MKKETKPAFEFPTRSRWNPLNLFAGFFKYEPEQLDEKIGNAAKELIEMSLAEVDENKLLDYHSHVVGLGSDDSGIYINEKLLTWANPFDKFKMKMYYNAAGIRDHNHPDRDYINRLIRLANHSPGKKSVLLAFDFNYNNDGSINKENSDFSVPNEYVYKLARQFPKNFIPAMSVHPYRHDALVELEKWAKKGIRIVKWLPNAMNIDPLSKQNDNFYKKMKELDLILLSHTGEEKAVKADDAQELGNPLRLRRPLDLGVKVIAAHCASLGTNLDLDHPGHKEKIFRLFMRLMDEKKYEGLLFADISAMTQANRIGEPLTTILDRSDLHPRLVNGSDYPLPAVNIVIRTLDLMKHKYITYKERDALNEIYKVNPLLFDFVLKRTIKHPISKKKLSPIIFMENPLLKAVDESIWH